MCSKRIILTQTQILTLTCASCRIVSEEIRQKCMTKISTWFILQRFSASKGFECLRAGTPKCWAPHCLLASVASLGVTLCLFSHGQRLIPSSATLQNVGCYWEIPLGSFGGANQLLPAESGHHCVLRVAVTHPHLKLEAGLCFLR